MQAKTILDNETQLYYNFSSNINYSCGIHYHDFYEIFLVVSGNVIHGINGKKQLLGKGSMVFMRPDDIHYYEKYGQSGCQLINTAFSQDVLTDFFIYVSDDSIRERLLKGLVPPFVLLSSIDTAAVKNKLDNLALLPREDKTQIKSYFRLLLAELISNYFLAQIKTEKEGLTWLDQLIDRMKEKENFRTGLPAMQKLSNRSHAYISRVIKDIYHITPTDFINEIRLNYCANLLVHSDTSIQDIALEAGFNNLSHFYHLFRKKYLLSPLHYRKQYQKHLSPHNPAAV